MGIFKQIENGGTNGREKGAYDTLRKEKYVSTCGGTLLVLVVVTVLNIIFLFTNGGYFFFSAYVPYVLSEFGLIFSSPELCEALQLGYPDLGKWPLVVALVVAGILIGLYLLCWAFVRPKRMGVSLACSQKARAMLIVALVLYGIDTLVLFPDAFNGLSNGDLTLLLCLLFHFWVIFDLVRGIRGYQIDIRAFREAPVVVEVEATVSTPEA